MPNVTQAGTYSKNTQGFDFLSGVFAPRVLLFAGVIANGTIKIQYQDDAGVYRTLENGEFYNLPRSFILPELQLDVILVVDGEPNFNVSAGA